MSTPTPPLPASQQPSTVDAARVVTAKPPTSNGRWQKMSSWFKLRRPIPKWQATVLGVFCCVGLVLVWWLLTRGKDADHRIVSRLTLPSPRETFAEFPALWATEVVVNAELPTDLAAAANDPSQAPVMQMRRELVLVPNTLATLRRVALGFLLAAAIGIPFGVLAGCFPPFYAFLAPVVTFGRNIPLAAIVVLLMLIFKTGEMYKIMFIFVACVSFILSDTARAISDVAGRYVDTAYTLGASTWQVISKVLVPLALPTIFSSGRLLFGIAFGYIMLAESTRDTESAAGLGYLIQIFQRRSNWEGVYLIVLIVPLIAFLVDQLLAMIQRQLFPHVYGGAGYLNRLIGWLVDRWEAFRPYFFETEWQKRVPAQTATTNKSS